MTLRLVWLLAMICGCASSRTLSSSLDLPEPLDTVEAQAPWDVLMDATASADPGTRGRALDALIRHAPVEQARSFMTVALFDPQPWVTAHCVEGIINRDPGFTERDAWTQKLEASRDNPLLLGRMLSGAASDNPDRLAWVRETLLSQPTRGGRAPLSRAAWTLGVEDAQEAYCADLRSGDLPMDTAWLLQIAHDDLACIDDALEVGRVGAEREIYDILSIVSVRRGTRAPAKLLREHLSGDTELQLERLDAWIASEALQDRATHAVAPKDPTAAIALRIAVAQGRSLRSTLREALDWTDPDLVELSLGLAERAVIGANASNQRAGVALLERASRSPQSGTRAEAVRLLADVDDDHPAIESARSDSNERVRLEAAVAIWRAERVRSKTPETDQTVRDHEE